MGGLLHQGTCEGCDGTGIRSPAEPSCQITALISSWTVVERCDCCEKFTDDAAAAREIFCTVRWIECEGGGWHAIARYLRR